MTERSLKNWSRDALRKRLAQPIANADDITGDLSHAERARAHALAGRTLRPAAVLALFVEMSDELHIVLTQRTAELKHHAGQISFPGGRQDDDDADLVATALREAREEIGVDPSYIETLGTLPRYVTITAYEVTPVVAISPPQTFVPEPGEVADVFTVPLSHFLNEENWRRDHLMREGVRREFWAVPYADLNGERYIWGATAGMLRVLAQHLRVEP